MSATVPKKLPARQLNISTASVPGFFRIAFIIMFVLTGLTGAYLLFFGMFVTIANETDILYIRRLLETISMASFVLVLMAFWGGLAVFCTARRGTIIISREESYD